MGSVQPSDFGSDRPVMLGTRSRRRGSPGSSGLCTHPRGAVGQALLGGHEGKLLMAGRAASVMRCASDANPV